MTTKTTTKTEKPRLRLSALEWRLVLIATLALAYVAAWFGLETRPERPRPEAAPPDRAPGPTAGWLDAPPRPERPRSSLPPGWTIASRRAPAAPRLVVPAPGASPRRIRTRSS